MADKVQIRRALISVSDKTDIAWMAKRLVTHSIEIISTGGTAKHLRENEIPIRDVSELTGFPEMMDGRIKTLHPKVHGGLLAIRDNNEHLAAMDEHGIKPIDLLIVNLYPFADPTTMAGIPYDEAVENIDIGGPAMIRAAAKNHAFVTVITDPSEYRQLNKELAQHGGATTIRYRRKLFRDAFKYTANFDQRVAESFFIRTLD